MNINRFDPPAQLAWCGADAVVASWEDYLLMVGPKEMYSQFFHDASVVLVSEVDSLRVVGPDRHEMFQRVPQVLGRGTGCGQHGSRCFVIHGV